MSSLSDSYQHYTCEEFNERLKDLAGVNRYDENNFILVWGQGGEDNALYRAGGYFTTDDFEGYRDLLIGGGVPCWCLLQWQSPEQYGTPELYELQNKDELGYQTLGGFPYWGRYRLLYSLSWRGMKDGKFTVEAMPLNSYLLDTIVPIIMEAQEISWEKTKAVMQDLQERENAADVSMIEDVMRSSALPFHGNAVSYQKQGCRTALVDKKIESLQRNWNAISSNAASFKGKGLLQG